MSTKMIVASWLDVAVILLAMASVATAQSDLGPWQKITTISDAKTHLVPRTWTLDKYPDTPTLTPHSTVTILDQAGPGVVTNFHVSNYAGGDASRLHLRVWYDRQDKPAVDMPLMDFLGDVQAAPTPYHTCQRGAARASLWRAQSKRSPRVSAGSSLWFGLVEWPNDPDVKSKVRRVCELQSLIRQGGTIR